MEALARHVPEFAVAAALAWGCGLRVYATLFCVGLAGMLGWIDLPSQLRVLESPLVLGASGFMTFVEFFADKIPWVDSLWDIVHTFIRIPAGAALAAAVFSDSGAAAALAAAILGGTICGGAHLSKAGGRAALNASPEPFSNWAASFGEDAAVPAALWLAFVHPVAFLVLLACFALVTILMVRWIARGLARLYSRRGA
ncbi:MAG: DUF4126 domain-containing protein [Burkholderiales bacterium]